MHQDDYLVLEDESGRVKLRGSALLPSVYVTGTFHKQSIITKTSNTGFMIFEPVLLLRS